ncbi:MAG: hypothetical protein LBB98_08190 [Treponema sp.]|nr:hypothetical protein [Treponema sp.]
MPGISCQNSCASGVGEMLAAPNSNAQTKGIFPLLRGLFANGLLLCLFLRDIENVNRRIFPAGAEQQRSKQRQYT